MSAFLFSYSKALLAVPIALFAFASPSFAQVNFHFGIDVAPPVPQVEEVPPLRPGFVWAPGYWNWDGDQHVWVGGHWMDARPGYYWSPERWEHHVEEEGSHWHFAPGRWHKDHGRWEHDHGRHENGHGEHHGHERGD